MQACDFDQRGVVINENSELLMKVAEHKQNHVNLITYNITDIDLVINLNLG